MVLLALVVTMFESYICKAIAFHYRNQPETLCSMVLGPGTITDAVVCTVCRCTVPYFKYLSCPFTELLMMQYPDNKNEYNESRVSSQKVLYCRLK